MDDKDKEDMIRKALESAVFSAPGFGGRMFSVDPAERNPFVDPILGHAEKRQESYRPEFTTGPGRGSFTPDPGYTPIFGIPYTISPQYEEHSETVQSETVQSQPERRTGESDHDYRVRVRFADTDSSYDEAFGRVQKWIGQDVDQEFADIVGNDDALSQLRDAIQGPVLHKELYAAYGMKMPKGALLSGPPGCGKTMFARAAVAEMRRLYGPRVEYVSISGSEIQSPYVGVTEGHIKAIFTFAREYREHFGHPLLVFMDEAEVLLPDRTGRVRRVANWEESQVATFLAEMDGISESGAFVLLAANRPEVMDQAVLRDGRCDLKIVIKRPNTEALTEILRKNFTGVFRKDAKVDDLVFAAVECLHDPNRILVDASAIGVDIEKEVHDLGHKHFLLEHIVSGAMAASIPERAKRYAFARDKLKGGLSGVQVSDVVSAVNDLFEENKALDHGFALAEFKSEFEKEVESRKMEIVKRKFGKGGGPDREDA